MNLIKSFNKPRGISLLKDELNKNEEEYSKRKQDIFRKDPQDCIVCLYQMNIMMQALNNKDYTLGTNNSDNQAYDFSPVFEEGYAFNEVISILYDSFQYDKENNSIDEVLNYSIRVSVPDLIDRNSYLYLVKVDTQYDDYYEYSDVYLLNKDYEKSIRSLNELYNNNSLEIIKIIKEYT